LRPRLPLPAFSAAERGWHRAAGARCTSRHLKAFVHQDEDDDADFSGPACEEYRKLARELGRVKYVLDETFRLVAHQPLLGPCVLRLEKLNPKNIEQARHRLTQVIDEHARRLREIRALHNEILGADETRAAERIAFGPGPEGERERKYVLSHDRHVKQSIATFLKVRKAGNDGTIDVVDAEDLLQSVDDVPQSDITDPSPAPAEEEPNHTSPKHRRRIRKTPKSLPQIVSQALCEEITCAEPPAKNNEPGPTPALAPAEPPPAPVAAGTVPVPSSITAPSAPPRTEGQRPMTRDEPTKDEPATDQEPMTKDELERRAREAQQKWFDALPHGIQLEIQDIRRQLWLRNRRPYLNKEEVSQFVAFLDKHLGQDSVGPESSLRPRRQNP
jgi:hypothetical protein